MYSSASTIDILHSSISYQSVGVGDEGVAYPA